VKLVKRSFARNCKHALPYGKVLSEQRQRPHDQNAPMKRLQLKVGEERDHVPNHVSNLYRKNVGKDHVLNCARHMS